MWLVGRHMSCWAWCRKVDLSLKDFELRTLTDLARDTIENEKPVLIVVGVLFVR
jgi:hypothetical protein